MWKIFLGFRSVICLALLFILFEHSLFFFHCCLYLASVLGLVQDTGSSWLLMDLESCSCERFGTDSVCTLSAACNCSTHDESQEAVLTSSSTFGGNKTFPSKKTRV